MNRQPTPSPRALAQRLESLHAAGVTLLPRKAAQPLPAAAAPAEAIPEPIERAAPPPAVRAPVDRTPAEPRPAPMAPEPAREPTAVATPRRSAAPTLEVLRAEVADCMACDELARTRQQTVFGVGDPNARLCFMGEAPGADEDRLGEPFVGRAGQLLTKMIEACTLRREEVYILNVLKCRPPGNRNPTPAESTACRGFLTRQLELIDPEYVCCLGAVAAQNFLEVATPIGRLRGRVHHHAGRKVVCTYHPAYLLRNPSAKKQAWEDLQMLMRELGVPL